MIKQITWKDIFWVWKHYLWAERTTPIEHNSAMCFLQGHDMKNMEYSPSFFGYYLEDTLVGVNSGHKCSDRSYRSRGLFVFEEFRKQGIGQKLLLATIEQAEKENARMIWTYPRSTSWKTYQSVGFELASKWENFGGVGNAFAKKNLWH